MDDTDGQMRFWVVFDPPSLKELSVTPPAVHEVWAQNKGTAEHILRETERACERRGIPWPHLTIRSRFMETAGDRALDADDVREVRADGAPHGFDRGSVHPEFATGLRVGKTPRDQDSLALLWAMWKDHIRRACKLVDECAASYAELQADCKLSQMAGDEAELIGSSANNGGSERIGQLDDVLGMLRGVTQSARWIEEATTPAGGRLGFITRNAIKSARAEGRLPKRAVGNHATNDLAEVASIWPDYTSMLVKRLRSEQG